MQLDEKELPDFMRELRSLLGQIKGFKGLTETFSLSYVIVVENEEQKENVIKIGNLLTEQAAKNHGIDLEVTPATEEDLKIAAELLRKQQEQKSSFVT